MSASGANALEAARQAWASGHMLEAQRLINSFDGSGPDKVKAHFLSGEIHRRIGDFHKALQEINACFDLLDQYPDMATLLRGPAHFNRALILYHRSDFAGSIADYQTALPLFEAEGMQVYHRQCLRNLAWTAIEYGNIPLAEESLQQSAESTTPDERWFQDVAESYLHWAQGSFAKALAICQRILSDDALEPELRALACAVAAHVAVDLGTLGEAVKLGGEAFSLAVLPETDPRVYSVSQKAQQRAQRAMLAQRGVGA